MRFIIYGAGAIGGVIGGHLSRVGHPVVLIGRPGHVQAIRAHGLRLVTPTGTYTLSIPAVTSPAEIDLRPDDVILLCVKGQNTTEALEDLAAVSDDVPVFCVQNGVRNEALAAERVERVYGVMVRVGGVYLRDGEVMARRDPPGWLIMGRYPTGVDATVQAVAASLRAAGFMVKVTPDVMPYKWGKLMGNLANAIGAITNARGPEVEQIARAARAEAARLLEQAGIRWISHEELAREWAEITIPPRGTLQLEAQSSTWQSLARRQGSVETDFLNGEIVRLAESLGTRAPINEGLLRITLEMAERRELPGKYTPQELADLLGIALSA